MGRESADYNPPIGRRTARCSPRWAGYRLAGRPSVVVPEGLGVLSLLLDDLAVFSGISCDRACSNSWPRSSWALRPCGSSEKSALRTCGGYAHLAPSTTEPMHANCRRDD